MNEHSTHTCTYTDTFLIQSERVGFFVIVLEIQVWAVEIVLVMQA